MSFLSIFGLAFLVIGGSVSILWLISLGIHDASIVAIFGRKVVGVVGDFWSPRKLLRRAVWHERDYAAYIRKL